MNNISTLLEEITIYVVENVNVNMEVIVNNNDEQAHIAFALLLVQAKYKRWLFHTQEKIREIGGEDTHVPDHMKERILMLAKRDAHQWLLEEGHELVDRALAWLLEEARKSNWFNSDYFSWDDLNQMLASMVDDQVKGSGSYYQIKTFVEEIVPAARANGIDPGVLLTSAHQVKKAKQLAPAFHDLKNRMETKSITEEEGEKTLRWMLDLAANPKVSAPSMDEELNKWRNRVVEIPKPLEGYVVLLPGGKQLYITLCNNPVESKLIANALRNKVDLTVVGLKWLLKFVSKLLEGRTNGNGNYADISPDHGWEVVSSEQLQPNTLSAYSADAS